MAQAVTKQRRFIWEGANQRGQRIKGELSAKSINLVKAELRRQGITPLKVRKKPMSLLSGHRKKISPKEITIFSRQLATMISAGVPVVQSLEVIGRGHENATMHALILNIKKEVEGGGTLADALRKHPKQFDKRFCSLVHAGEQSGTLEVLLDKIALYKEKIEAIKGKIKK